MGSDDPDAKPPEEDRTIAFTTRAHAREGEQADSMGAADAITDARQSALDALARLRARHVPRRKPAIHVQRVAAARRRILEVMNHRIVCYQRELERRVVEVGFNFATTPESKRPQPVHFGEALRDLTRPDPEDEDDVPYLNIWREQVVVRTDPPTFGRYSFVVGGAGTQEQAMEIMNRKRAAVAVYHRVIEYEPELSGWHAEAVHHSALVQAPGWVSVGWDKGAHIRHLHDRSLSVGDVDMAGVHLETGVRFVAEIKNQREWLYESTEPIWALLGAAAELDAVPILIARRVPETVYALMKAVGGIAFRSTKLILHPDARDWHEDGRPSFASAARELGFHSDIDYLPADGPLPRHRALWTTVLPPQMTELIDRFRQVEDVVRNVAFDEGLRAKGGHGKATGRTRNRIVHDALATIRERFPDDEE